MVIIKKKIIACEIFTDELLAVLPETYRNIDITWLDSGQHMDLDKLEMTLKQEIRDAETEGVDLRFLFGNACHPDICHIINNHDGNILGTKNCIEAFCHENIEELEKIVQ